MKKGTLLIIIGLLLIVAALCLTAYNIWDASRAGQAVNDTLEELIGYLPDEKPSASGEFEYPDYVLNPYMDMPVKTIGGIDYIGVLNIPSLQRSLPVAAEWSYPKLKIAPCRYRGSAYLNDLIICAHNYNYHFGTLRNLSYGDIITFTDMDGNTFTYEVQEIETLKPTAIEEMIESEWDLTLFTCTVGGATRVTVRCSVAF